ncbi:bifunctional biotin--[acetyl-CoA-carboxylase] ligase/biotin operon repressor BirA [Glaciecola sp. 1036]|uniref:bifunctional biotin--[acetyl-CoA-carboxylase] ligase/biotin operon repressor BirA n=1 Tax=Alteromonadaceae TaxID=72275 RepID=UPI003D030CA8
MSPNQIRTQIIRALSEGQFVSGESLAAQLNITRSSISNYMKSLKDYGLDVFSVKGRGYQIAQPLTLLDQNQIEQYLHTFEEHRLNVLNIVGSTNDEIKQQLADLPKGAVCIAECQTQGRGRRGRKWVSPFGTSIYLSMSWRFESGYQSIAGLSLLIGLAVKRTLSTLGYAQAKLKWPNDVYVDDKKLAGILIEVEGQVGGVTSTVIGIGINVNLPKDDLGIDQAFTDLMQISEHRVDRNLLAGELINQLRSLLVQFEVQGLGPFVDEWQTADVFRDQPVALLSGNYKTTGINRGIDQSGALLLEVDGEIKPYHGGEISVRKL